MQVRTLALTAAASGAIALFILQACSSDPEAVPSGTPDASMVVPRIDADVLPNDGGLMDGTTNLLGFTVPAGGGFLEVQVTGYGKLTFVFPASAANKNITVELSSAAAVGLPTSLNYLVLKLGPDGTTFTDPVIVKPETLSQVGAMFTLPDTGGPGEGLALNAARDGFVMNHFTSLVITPPGTVCEMQMQSDSPASGRCLADAGNTTFRSLSCNVPGACIRAAGSCCVLPDAGAAGCSVANQVYGVTWSDYSTAATPLCDDNAGEWDGGASTCGNNEVSFQRGQGDSSMGCTGERTCTSGNYRMTCDGTTCRCFVANVQGRTFAQDTTCSSSVKFRGQFVRGCNFPLHR